MRRYSFRLEQVLKLRKAHEEKAAVEQALAANDYQINFDRFCEAKNKLASAQALTDLNDPFDLMNQIFYCNSAIDELSKRKTLLTDSQVKLEQCRKNLIHAMQDKSVIEKLKQKDRQNYDYELYLIDQKETDELANRQYIYFKAK